MTDTAESVKTAPPPRVGLDFDDGGTEDAPFKLDGLDGLKDEADRGPVDKGTLAGVSQDMNFPRRDPSPPARAGESAFQPSQPLAGAGEGASPVSELPVPASPRVRRPKPNPPSQSAEAAGTLNIGALPYSIHDAIDDGAAKHRHTRRGYILTALRRQLKADGLESVAGPDVWEDMIKDSRRRRRG